MASKFQEYVDAVSDLASSMANYAGLTPMTKGAQAIVLAYNNDLKAKNEKKEGDVLPIEKWLDDKETIAKIAALKEVSEEDKKQARDYINTDTKVKAVKNDLFEKGKYTIEQAGNFLSKITDFIKQNPYTLGALGLGLVAGNALELGIFGTLAVAAVTTIAGAVLGDKEHGIIGSQLFNMKPENSNEKSKAVEEPTKEQVKEIKVDTNNPTINLSDKIDSTVSIELKNTNASVATIEAKVKSDCNGMKLIVNKSQLADSCGNPTTMSPHCPPLEFIIESGNADITKIIEKIQQVRTSEVEKLTNEIGQDNNKQPSNTPQLQSLPLNKSAGSSPVPQ